jgi:hypothetical protein
MYVRGYLQGSENGRVVTIDIVLIFFSTYCLAYVTTFSGLSIFDSPFGVP